jgi:hypothetical protein
VIDEFHPYLLSWVAVNLYYGYFIVLMAILIEYHQALTLLNQPFEAEACLNVF